jgi:hypothetical protein
VKKPCIIDLIVYKVMNDKNKFESVIILRHLSSGLNTIRTSKRVEIRFPRWLGALQGAHSRWLNGNFEKFLGLCYGRRKEVVRGVCDVTKSYIAAFAVLA